MKNRRLKQFWIVSFAVFSLLASSIAACACSHHHHKPSAETLFSTTDCHHSAEMSEMESSSGDSVSFSKVDEVCGCVYETSQPFVVGKSDNIKDQDVLAALPEFPAAKVEIKFVEISFEKIYFTARFYNSNYLKRLSPSRAPPVSQS